MQTEQSQKLKDKILYDFYRYVDPKGKKKERNGQESRMMAVGGNNRELLVKGYRIPEEE